MYEQINAYLNNTPGSIVISQEGIVNLLGAVSLLPASVQNQVEKTPGVEKVSPILSQFVILDLHGRKQPTYFNRVPTAARWRTLGFGNWA